MPFDCIATVCAFGSEKKEADDMYRRMRGRIVSELKV
jgi:hypothetical protein